MAVIGFFTDTGVNKSREAQNNEGFKIFPESFSVSNVATPGLDPTITAPNAGVFFTGNISSYVTVSDDTVQINCVIPPAQTAALETINEIYVFAKDISNNDFLLAVGSPETTSNIIYDPTGETTLRLQFTLVGADLSTLYEFAFTQATEISQHNQDANAHPVIQDAIKKAGIFPQISEHEYIGQNFDQFASFDAGVSDGDFVYKDTDNVYKLAIFNAGNITSQVAGIADVTRSQVYTGGFVEIAHGYAHGTILYLSDLVAGSITSSVTGKPVGMALDGDVISLNIEHRTTIPPEFDAVVSDANGLNHFPTHQEAIDFAPNNGWIRVDKIEELRSTSPLSTAGKRLNFYYTGVRSGLKYFEGQNEFQKIDFNPITPDAGKYVLVHDGNKTADLPFNANAADVGIALQALPSINEVLVTGNTTDGFTLEFTGVDGNQNITPVSAGTDVGVDEVQNLNFSSDDFNAGSFKIDFDGQLTNAIAFNSINAATIQSELNALSNLSAVTVLEVAAPVGQKNFEITFAGADGKVDQPLMSIPAPDNSLVDSGSSPITITPTEVTQGVLPDNTLTKAAVGVSIVASTLIEGEGLGSTTAFEFSADSMQFVGLGRLENFVQAFDFNGFSLHKIEMWFDNITTPFDQIAAGTPNLDYTVQGSIGIGQTNLEDSTLFRDLVRVDPQFPTPDETVSITAGEVVTGDGSLWGFTYDQYVSSYAGGSIDFSTGVISGAGDNFTPHTPTAAGNYFRYGIGLTVNDKIIVIPPVNDAATAGGAFEPNFENCVPRAVVLVKDNGTGGSGTIDAITPASVKRFFTNSGIFNTVKSEEFITAGGESQFSVTSFEWSTDHTVLDIEVYLNGDKQTQSKDGLLDKDFRKLDENTIEFSYNIPVANTRVEIVYIGNQINAASGSGISRKYKVIADGLTDTFSPVGSDPLFTWDASNTVYDIDVYLNGNHQDQGSDFNKISNNDIQFTYTPANNAKVEIYSKAGGSGGGSGGSSNFVTEDEGVVIDAETVKYDFVGPAISATQTAPGEVQISATGEANTASNQGTGAGEILIGKVGQDLQLRNVIGGFGIAVTLDANNNIVISLASSVFFVSHEYNFSGLLVTTPQIFDTGTNKLSPYRNGVKMILSSTAGAASQRYLEASPSSLSLFAPAVLNDVFSYVNIETPPTFRQIITAVTGSTLTVNTYTLGSGRLSVYRNGQRMNDGGVDLPTLQYGEASTTTLSLNTPAVSTDVFEVIYDAVAPNFVEYVSGPLGTTVNLVSNTYTLGTDKLLVYRNGILMFNTTDINLGPAAQRYQENTTSSITLESPGSTATDTWTFVELP